MKQLRQSAAFAVAAWLVRALTFVLLVSAGTLFVVSVGVYATEIVLRGGFRTSFPEYYEIVGIAFIYVFLLGAAALYARNEDIIIDLGLRPAAADAQAIHDCRHLRGDRRHHVDDFHCHR